jgi:uncharacterized protein YaaQ
MVVTSKAVLDGQVFALPINHGVGYFQALFFVKKWGYWIKVFRGVRDVPVDSPSELVGQEAQFYTFFPLIQAVKAGVVRSIGSLQVEPSDRALPRLKTPGGVLRDGTVTDWFLIDGERVSRVHRLSDDERRLQDQMVVNDTALAEMLAEGWTPETSVHVQKSGSA